MGSLEKQREMYFDTTETPKIVDFVPNETIKMYKDNGKLLYPFIMLEADVLPEYRVRALQILIQKATDEKKQGVDIYDFKTLNVYILIEDKIIGLGEINRENLNSLLKSNIYSYLHKEVHLDEKTVLHTEMQLLSLYSLE